MGRFAKLVLNKVLLKKSWNKCKIVLSRNCFRNALLVLLPYNYSAKLMFSKDVCPLFIFLLISF